MHRPAMLELHLLQHPAHRRRFRAYQMHDALPLVLRRSDAVQAVQPGGGQRLDAGQVDDHRPVGPDGLHHSRGERRAAVGIDLAVDPDDRDRIPAPALDSDSDRRAEVHLNGRPLCVRDPAKVARVEPARCRCTGSPQDRRRGPGAGPALPRGWVDRSSGCCSCS